MYVNIGNWIHDIQACNAVRRQHVHGLYVDHLCGLVVLMLTYNTRPRAVCQLSLGNLATIDFTSLCSMDCPSKYTVTNNPTRCTILFKYIYLSFFYMFRSSKCPSSGENYCIYATLVFVTLGEWRLVCWLDWNQSTRRHPSRVTNASVA